MQKMSKLEESKMADTLLAVIDRVNAGENPNDVIVEIADREGYTGERAARLCEASNKLASIERLASRDERTRKASFPLADAEQVVSRLNAPPSVKKASAPLRKTGDVGIARVDHAPSFKLSDEELLYTRRIEVANKIAEEVSLSKTSIQEYEQTGQRAAEEAIGAEEGLKSLVSEAGRLGSDDAAELARYIQATYGEQGKELIKLLNSLLEQDLPQPTVKEAAAYVASPDTPCVREVDRFMGHVHNHVESLANRALAAKEAVDPLAWAGAIMGATIKMDKQESEEPPVNPMKNPFKREVFSRMKRAELKDTFANMYLDDKFLLSYPPETVLDAYNKVMQLYPGLARRQNSDALITSAVKKIITSNSEIDPLEISAAASTEKALADAMKITDASSWE